MDGFVSLGKIETANPETGTPQGEFILGRLTYKSRRVGIPADQKVPTTGHFRATETESLLGTKEKIVEHWTYKTQNEELHVELCTVPPLGDFLEIEVIKETQNPEEIAKIKQLEEQLLQECEIPLSQIEPKYYSQMLEGCSVKKVQDSGKSLL